MAPRQTVNRSSLIFSAFAVALAVITTSTAVRVHAQEQQAKKPGPARVTPPDIFLDEKSEVPEEVEELPNTSREPLPQIKRKKDYVDPRFRPESRFIEHPNAEKGLIKIDKNKVYQYKVKTSEQKSSAALRFGMYEPTELANPEDASLTFDELYDQTDYPFIAYDQDWIFFKKFGELAWKIGGALYVAQGNGRFAASPGGFNQGQTPREKFTLIVVPITVGVSYKLKYFNNQWLIPYVEGGLDAFNFAEVRDDNKNPSIGAKLGLAPAAHASAGLSLPLGRDASSFLDLDREYGINAVYLTAEFRHYFALSSKFDFSGDAITGGITADY